MKKQRITKGSILEIPIDNKYYIYAQILEKSSYVFFDFISKEQISDFELLNEKPILFIISVYDQVVTKGEWLKVGKINIRKELEVLPMFFIQDPINKEKFRIYDANTGEIVPATKREIIGLERASVWNKTHVEDRIRDFYNKVPCVWLEEDRKLFNRELP